MDRRIEKKKWPARKVIALLAGAGTVAAGCLVLASVGKSSLRIDPAGLQVAQVRQGDFREYVPIQGAVQAGQSVLLDLEEGGIVRKVHIEGGNRVGAGDLIISLSNTTAQKQNIEAETRLIDNLNQLRNSKIALTQSSLLLKAERLELDYRIRELQRTYARFAALMQQPNPQLSQEQFEATRDELAHLQQKRELLSERIRSETALRELQDAQITTSVARVTRNLELLNRIMESLEVRAPVSGYLSSLSAEVGQSLQRGQSIGQIDQLDTFKVRASIDQYYIAKISTRQHGTFRFDGKTYSLSIVKVYPEVKNDSFQVDLEFDGPVPAGIKRGQTLQIDLSLSESKTTRVVDRGSFQRHTNGRWAYKVAEDGRTARRVRIVLGRQNPDVVEVLEGLGPGDRIITSDYARLEDVEELTFTKVLEQRAH